MAERKLATEFIDKDEDIKNWRLGVSLIEVEILRHNGACIRNKVDHP